MALKVDGVLRAADQVLELAKTHGSALEPRLAAGFFDLIKTDAAIIRADGDVQALRSSKKASTVTQNDAVRQGFDLVGAIRAVVRTGAPSSKTLWKAFGVGATVSPTVRSVAGALSTILTASSRFPSETAAVGILAADLQRAQTYAAAIATADSAQETAKLTSKQTTAQLKSAVARLTDNLQHVASIARVALPADAAAEFADAIPSSSRKKPAPSPA